MFVEVSRTLTEIVRFTNRHRIDAEFHLHTVGQLQGETEVPDPYWAKFEKYPGVYLIFDVSQSAVRYIGMSERDTGSRLYRWLFKENKVNDVLQSGDIVLSVVLREQFYMAPALESYLIQKLRPVLNVRGAV